MEFNKIIDAIRYSLLAWLGIESFLTGMFFRAIIKKGGSLPVFKIKADLFMLNGAQYFIGFFVGIIITTIPNPSLITFLRTASLFIAIPLIIAIRRYRGIFMRGDAELTVNEAHIKNKAKARKNKKNK